MQHVSECKIVLPTSTSGKIPYVLIHGYVSGDLQHIYLFSCRTEYHQVMDRQPMFDARLKDSISVRPEGLGLFTVLTRFGTVRKPHVRSKEDVFPGLNACRSYVLVKELDGSEGDGSSEVSYIITSKLSDNATDSDDRNNLSLTVNPVTYIPAQPSTFGQGDQYIDGPSSRDSGD